MSRPSVSVVVPVYNAARFLDEAIRSILGQRHAGLELIVVDDGSTDGSGDVARRYPEVHCHAEPRSGPGAARNAGIALAGADLFAFLDADDTWVEGKLARQLDVLGGSPAVEAVFGHVRCFASPDLPATEAARVHVPSEPLAGPHVGTMLIRRGAFARVGPFREGLRAADFVEWYTRAVDAGLASVMLPDVLLHRRIHASNTARVRGEIGGEFVRVLKTAIDRRRPTAGR
jgi:glycosyltransferase involved in cell wall biosynthesis